MKNRIGLLLCAVIIVTILGTGCANENLTIDRKLQQTDTVEEERLEYTNSMKLSYANQFSVDYYKDGYTLIRIADGSRYLVVPEKMTVPKNLETDIKVIKQPVSHIYLAATSAMGLFDVLDGLSAISLSGTKADAWCIENAKKAMEDGRISYAGKYSEPDYEQILSQNCKLAIESTMINHMPEVKEKLEETGITVLTDWSSYEEHPLGRTEWMKLYAVLLGKEDEATKLFKQQEAYLNAAGSGEKTDKTIAFFYISPSGYAVARKSEDYVTKMITLAGGNYIFEHLGDSKKATSTVNMEMEKFYATAKDADYIIYNGTIDGGVSSMDELIAKNKLLKDFKAVRENHVWCTNQNLYQETTQIGTVIAEMHQIIENPETDAKDFQFLKRVQ